MKEHGILMSAPMIRAYLAGRKGQTRRTRGLERINLDPDHWKFSNYNDHCKEWHFSGYGMQSTFTAPYGLPGDFLYFKETWAIICQNAVPLCECETPEEETKNHTVEFKADTGNPYPGEWPAEEAKGNPDAPKWKSSLFMPRKLTRVIVPIIDVKVQRLNDISLQDALEEGVDSLGDYRELWNKLNGPGSWDRNPWIWVYKFPKLSQS